MSRIRFLERVPLISHALNRTPQPERQRRCLITCVSTRIRMKPRRRWYPEAEVADWPSALAGIEGPRSVGAPANTTTAARASSAVRSVSAARATRSRAKRSTTSDPMPRSPRREPSARARRDRPRPPASPVRVDAEHDQVDALRGRRAALREPEQAQLGVAERIARRAHPTVASSARREGAGGAEDLDPMRCRRASERRGVGGPAGGRELVAGRRLAGGEQELLEAGG
jgi:hypothetical protein